MLPSEANSPILVKIYKKSTIKTKIAQPRFSHASFDHELANIEIVLNPGNRKTTASIKKDFAL